ncbi:M48 family metalloprotease [Actinacidiphila oryziradicis]|uniref:Peptidase n=1 Tax=Actinacidiphila oryziradicis TaxID=2571141 RepID=A0A4U0S4Q5_9ACTN|nr:M48 family metallopeptidase [Actinacidiphila oryziradicis]TKA03067.1 peptidase [Actinacidiphila oryziradicis]
MRGTAPPNRIERGGLSISVRAALAVVLPAGFYLLALGIVVGTVAVDVALAEHSNYPFSVGAFKVYLASALLVYPVLRVVFLSRRPRHGAPAVGLPVTPEEQPELWARVRQLAERTGTRPPAEIRLIAEVNAAVSEQSRLLDLLPGRRTLAIGVPLLIGLTEAELGSVLAHEFGHYSNQDARLGGHVYAGRREVLRTVGDLHRRADRKQAEQQAQLNAVAAARRAKGRKIRKRLATGGLDRVLAMIFAGYAKLYVTVSESVNRRQEYAADLAAVRIAGRDVTAATLRKLPSLDAALSFYLDHYAMLGWEDGLLPLPGQVYGGLANLLTDPKRRQELTELRLELPEDEHDPYDSHPPIAARVAAVESLPPDGCGPDTSGPALGVLARSEQTLAALEAVTLLPEAAAMSRLDWPELAHRAGCARHTKGAEALRQAVGAVSPGAALAAVLDAVAAGRRWELADRLPKSPQAQAATGRAAQEFTRPVFRSALRDLVILALAETGAARWELSWSEPVRLRLADGLAEALPPALDAVMADPQDVTALRTLLASTPLSRLL